MLDADLFGHWLLSLVVVGAETQCSRAMDIAMAAYTRSRIVKPDALAQWGDNPLRR
jgi:hypothetical protein